MTRADKPRPGPHWFAPKRVGIGAGLPIAWQGWALVVGYIALMLFAAALVTAGPQGARLAGILLMLAASLSFVAVAARTTRGGWRWRSGQD